MQLLTYINDCLGTMGEAPLNAEDDPHPYRAACVSILDSVNRECQALGWWFNREFLTLHPDALDSGIYVPGDTINVRLDEPGVVQRYRRLYQTKGGTYVFTKPLDVTLIRLVPFKECPELYATYVAAEGVVRFQSRYDGDTAKSRELKDTRDKAKGYLSSEETRQVKANMLDSNARLQFIKRHARNIR